MWLVQTGKGKGKYSTKYSLQRKGQALAWYAGVHVHSGHKKRLVDPEGRVIARTIT